ncbi:MAG: leucine-rich repeat domain-containing protein [Lachnospiraceae bacterium]|nr:leucine-rich repeat domain-containing protein [Lachnospiraceae bacterium]
MKQLWKRHKFLMLSVPIVLVIAFVGFIWYLQYKKNAEVSECIEAGNNYLSELKYEQAIAAYSQALEIDEKNWEANLGLAGAYEVNDMGVYAEAIYKNMLEMDGTNADIYTSLAELYMSENKLEEAKELLEEAITKVQSEHIDELYLMTKPEAPTANYISGEYEKRIRVELFAGENQTIYYTLDGTNPTVDAENYNEGIILKNGKTTLKAMAVNGAGYQSDTVVYEYNVLVEDVVVELREPVIERIVRESLELTYNEPIYNDDIEQITELYVVGERIYADENLYNVYLKENGYILDGYEYYLSGYGQITTLEDLTYMPFLEKAVIVYQPEIDVSDLAVCTSIKELSLVGNNLSEKELSVISKINGLKKLNIGWNNIKNISFLSGLSNLESLAVWGNDIEDIAAVKNLTNLKYLDFSENRVMDILSVAGLTNLEELWMYDNKIKDISSLNGLDNLKVVMLRDNPISNPEEIRSIYPHLIRLDEDLLNLGGETK